MGVFSQLWHQAFNLDTFFSIWYPALCVIAPIANFKVKAHRVLTCIIAAEAAIGFVFRPWIFSLEGANFYLFCASVEIGMVMLILTFYLVSKLQFNLHALTLTVASLLFVIVHIVRAIDRYKNHANEFASIYQFTTSFVYVIYFVVMLTPILGQVAIWLSKIGRNRLQDGLCRVLYRIGFCMLWGLPYQKVIQA